MRKDLRVPPYTPILIILSFIVYCIEIDLAVPSFPAMKSVLQTTEAWMQMSLSLNFFGFFLGALLYGPLSDSFGRRPVILSGCTIYVIGGIGCALMNSIDLLLLFRFIQGLGASSGCVILYAMIADIYPPEKMAWFHGIMNATITVVMAGAPILGSFISQTFGWRYPLITIAVLSIMTLVMMVVLLPETRVQKTPWHLKSVVSDYKRLLVNHEFTCLTFGPSLLVGVYMTFVGTAPFFYQTQLGLSVFSFGLHQGAVLASFSLVSLFTGKINHWLGMKRSAHYGNILAITAAAILYGLSFYLGGYPYSITFFMCLHVMGIALSFGTTVAIAFNVVPEVAGASSSLIMASRLLFSSLMVAYASKTYNGTWASISLILLGGAFIGILLITRGMTVSKSKNLHEPHGTPPGGIL